MNFTLPEPSKEPVSCNSWVLTSPNGEKVFQTCDRPTAQRHLSAGWNCKTAYQHFTDLNNECGSWGENWKLSK